MSEKVPQKFKKQRDGNNRTPNDGRRSRGEYQYCSHYTLYTQQSHICKSVDQLIEDGYNYLNGR